MGVNTDEGSVPGKALSGLLVVSLEHAVAGPLASCRLADAGARVIKLERPGGDFARGYDRAANGMSSYFAWLNRGKESIVVDLKQEADRALVGRMLARADIYLQNLAAGTAARVGFGSAALRLRHPALITCDISGYGDRGPYRDMKAYDLLVQGETGLLSVSGPPGPMGRVGVSVCDIATGMNAALAIQQAIVRRMRTGVGEAVHVSLFDSIAEWMTVPLLHAVYLGKPPDRLGIAHPSISPYGEFRTVEGRSVIISVQNEHEWREFAVNVLRRPDWLADHRFGSNVVRVEHRAFVDASIQEVIGSLDHDELISRLQRYRIAYGVIHDVAGLERHPQLRQMTVRTELGEVRYPAPAIQSPSMTGFGEVPALDQHGQALRAEFGEPS